MLCAAAQRQRKGADGERNYADKNDSGVGIQDRPKAGQSHQPIDQSNCRRKKQNGNGAGQQSGIYSRHARSIAQTLRFTNICLISPMALAGFRFFGQALAQFMIVWQR